MIFTITHNYTNIAYFFIVGNVLILSAVLFSMAFFRFYQ